MVVIHEFFIILLIIYIALILTKIQENQLTHLRGSICVK